MLWARSGSEEATAEMTRRLVALREVLTEIRARGPSGLREGLERHLADLRAVVFHVEHRPNMPGEPRPLLLGLFGGTGTGKSTLVNRLLGRPEQGEGAITATSFRRTFTAGPVAVASEEEHVPPEWADLPRKVLQPRDLPARGTAGALTVALAPDLQLPRKLVLVDTPDLDGDVPEHHAQADRVFRWCQAVLFVTTPEKYQMTELLAYYRLARRYAVPARFVMNKVDDPEAANDWRRLLVEDGVLPGREGDDEPQAGEVFVIPRDDAGFTAPAGRDLAALRESLIEGKPPSDEKRRNALAARCGDLASRVDDQLLAPLEQRLRQVEQTVERLRALIRPEPGVDVHPMTRQLQRRLQQQSVLYLMGPARVLERLRSVPGFIARLPRHTWDLLTRGRLAQGGGDVPDAAPEPDFRRDLEETFLVVQSRIGDVLADSGIAAQGDWRLAPSEAGQIADEELARLQRWLEQRWDAKPRDTRTIERLLKFIPGGRHVTKMSEAAPYLLAAACATTNAVVGPIDMLVLGGYSLVTWLSEKLSNEVAGKTRETNRAISDRFAELCERQVREASRWARATTPDEKQLTSLRKAVEALGECRQ